VTIEDYVPAAQIRGWLRSLCEQNQPNIANIVQGMRIGRARKIFKEQRRLIDRSQTDRDRTNTAHFYHVAFARLAKKWAHKEGGAFAVYNPQNGVQSFKPWMFDEFGKKKVGGQETVYEHEFANLSETDLSIVPPTDLPIQMPTMPNAVRSVFPAIAQLRIQRHTEQVALVGSELLWAKAHLPTRTDLFSHSLLSLEYIPSPIIWGLPAAQEKPKTKSGQAILEKIEHINFGPKNRAIARFFANNYPEGRPRSIRVTDFCIELREKSPDLDFGSDETMRRDVNGVWKRVKPGK